MIPEFWVWLLTTGMAVGAITVYGIATLTFRLGDQALEVVALGVPFRTIPYADIESADRGGSLIREHWVSFRLRSRITLRLRQGKRRSIVITPPDPDAFLLDLRSRLHAAPFRESN
ncbi:MAG: hypothetical protein ABSD47_19385 [Candidatus Methylomirabilota bacterium]